MRTRDELVAFADELIAEGSRVLASKFTNQMSSVEWMDFVELQIFSKWSTSVAHLCQMTGPFAKPWEDMVNLSIKNNQYVNALRLQGIVQSIRENLDSGRLSRIEDLVASETFANLLEQAEHLLKHNYFLAAGVLCRAVLEERLKMLCERESCLPTKTRPTINDYAQGLYAANFITKIALKSIEAMAAVGNDAAHNSPTLTDGDVQQLYSNLVDFMQRYET